MGAPSLPLICGSDDDRANLMWKCYLEREDSKIVGMEWAKQWGLGLGRGMRARLGDDVKWFVESGGGGGIGVRKAGPAGAGFCRLRRPTVTLSCFCLYPDLFVGQLKSCLKCQACGYRSTTFEVFCDLSLPIPKVGFQKVPRVDETWVL